MKKKFLVLIILTALTTTGCSISFGNSSAGPVVKGVFKSVDKGDNWTAKNLFLHSGGTSSIETVDVVNVVFDPQDNQAIYTTTNASGLLYSYDGGESWMKAQGIEGRVESLAVDPANKCVIYATAGNTVVKSVDCSRSWSEIYIDTRADKAITALAVDHFNNLTVYAGNISGDILKSTDGGVRWQAVERLGDRIKKILIDKADSRIMYVATQKKGIFKTTDAGQSWVDLNDGLKQYSGSFEYRNLIFDPTQGDSLLLVSKYGLLTTIDAGSTWQSITLITPPATTDIFAVAISPQNNQEIYYATASTFYKTMDGGQNWITKRLPSLAIPSALLINPQAPHVIYLSLTAPPKR